MSEITDFYVSWQGCSAFGPGRIRLREPEPIPFNPLDISGCRIWLDANDTNAVSYNELLQVSSWSNKGTLGGTFDLSGAGIVTYAQMPVNGLNTISFNDSGFLQGFYALNFQDRTIFTVIKPLSYTESSPIPIFSSDTSNCQEFFFVKNGTWLTFDGKHPSPIPENAFEYAIDFTSNAYLTTIATATDLSNNISAYNSTPIVPIYQAAASFSTSNAAYFVGNYFGGSGVNAQIDYCEIIMYEGVLSETDRQSVEAYLTAKWAISPTPLPSPPLTLIGEWDLNNYDGVSATIPNSVVGGSDATISEYSNCTFDNSTSGNYNLLIYAPNNFPGNTAGITLPSLSNVSAIEFWVNYIETFDYLNYAQYVIDARTGASDAYWITNAFSSTDLIGSFFTNGKIYFNTVQQPVDVSAGQPIVGPTLYNGGWYQVVIVPETPITDDIALFMRYTANQGMPVYVADICVYENTMTASDVITIFNSKCSRYGLSPI